MLTKSKPPLSLLRSTVFDMNTLHTIADLRSALLPARRAGQRIALVPTMGNLHAGHIRLVSTARQHADLVVTSIFVNPLQFGANEDLDSYPRTLAADQQQLAAAGCDLVFAPSERDIYPRGRDAHTLVTVPGLSELYCGATRPGHFDGVTTVVCKLFNIVQPDVAIFGEKDFQQLAIIRRMCVDLDIPVEIVGVPTERAPSGLALSSRNGYLSEEERQRAAALQSTLQQLATRLKSGANNYSILESEALQTLEQQGFRGDYLRIVNRHTLQPAGANDKALIILAAAWMGPARLIDNLSLDLL